MEMRCCEISNEVRSEGEASREGGEEADIGADLSHLSRGRDLLKKYAYSQRDTYT